MNVAGEMLTEDVEIRFLPVSSHEAASLGAKSAPALVVNRRMVVQGVPSVEEIRALLEKARPVTLGIILTKSPQGAEDAENALEAATAALATGDRVALFLLSDGVWLARRGALSGRLEGFLSDGGEVYVSGEHIKAAGLEPEKLAAGAAVAGDAFDCLVDLVMDEWDRVLVF